MASLAVTDYVVFAGFLVISLGIGVYHAITGGRQRTTAEFIMADRKLSFLPTTLSMLVSYQSAIMILGFTAEIYMYGGQMWLMSIIGVTIAVVIAERLMVPWFYPLRLTSVYEYMEMRFQSKAARMTSALIGLIYGTLYIGMALYAPSTALEAASNIPAALSIPVMAAVCTCYTSLGGMRAVIWTDVFQFVVILTGILAIIITGCIQFGGLSKGWEISAAQGRLPIVDFDPNPTTRHTFWGFLIGSSSIWIFMYGVNQPSVQRFMATKSEVQARLTVLCNIPLMVIMRSLVSIIGIVTFAHYTDSRCDPITTKKAGTSNQILTLYVTEIFRKIPGFSGLFLAALYSGALSSISSSLSACAANTWEDILKHKFLHWSEYRATVLNKFLVLLFGALGTGFGLLAMNVPGPATQVASAFLGASGGPLLGMFLLGGLFPMCNWKGAIAGGFVGLAVNMFLSIGASIDPSVAKHNRHLPLPATDGCSDNNFTQTTSTLSVNRTFSAPPPLTGLSNLYAISYLWYGQIGASVAVSVGLLVSLFTGRSKSSDFPKHLLMNPRKHIFHIPFCQGVSQPVVTEKDEGPVVAEKPANDSSSHMHVEEVESIRLVDYKENC